MRHDNVGLYKREQRHKENMKKNREAFNRILKDLKAGKSATIEEQQKFILLAAWAVLQASPAMWRALVDLKGDAHSQVFQALWHFSEHWVDKSKPAP